MLLSGRRMLLSLSLSLYLSLSLSLSVLERERDYEVFRRISFDFPSNIQKFKICVEWKRKKSLTIYTGKYYELINDLTNSKNHFDAIHCSCLELNIMHWNTDIQIY